MSFEDHWPTNRRHQWKTDKDREHCSVCGVYRTVWHEHPCGSHPWTLQTPEGQITAGITENGGFWPLAWPDTLDEDRAADAMHAFFREHGDDIRAASNRPVKQEGE